MSLLSDLLSKIKHPEPRKDVPPGLRKMVSTLQKKELRSRRILIFSVFIAIALGSGFVMSYLVRTYLTKEILKERRAMSTEQRTGYRVQKAESNIEQRANSKEELESLIPAEKPEAMSKEQNNPPSSPFTKGARLSSVGQGQRGIIEKESEGRLREIARAKGEEQRIPSNEQKKLILSPEIIAQKKDTRTEDIKGQTGVSPEVQTSEMKDLYLYTAGNYEKGGDYSNAISSYKKVLDIEPGNYRVMNKIAHILIRMSSHEDALKYLENALTIKHDYVPALINAGIVYAKEEKSSEAEKYFLKVLSFEEINKTALLNLALLYERQGNYEKAREYYLRLQRLGDVQGNLGLERVKSGY